MIQGQSIWLVSSQTYCSGQMTMVLIFQLSPGFLPKIMSPKLVNGQGKAWAGVDGRKMQCSVDKRGVMWPILLLLVRTLAAALWTNWSLFIHQLEHPDYKAL